MGQSGARLGNPGGTANKAGNGVAGGKARPPGGSASAATAATKAGARPSSAITPQAAGRVAGGPVGRLLRASWSPFRQMGAVPLATFILSLYGLGASIYLTLVHYDSSIPLVCSGKGFANCEAVTTSPESMVFGVLPVAVLGLAFYVFMVAVNSPWGWRQKWPAVRWARFGSVIVGMVFVLYLIYAEIDLIHAICLWCTSVHVATFLIFALLVFYTTFTWGRPLEQTGTKR